MDADLKRLEEFWDISRRILRHAQKGVHRSDFLRKALGFLLRFSKSDEIWIDFCENNRWFHAELGNSSKFQVVSIGKLDAEEGLLIFRYPGDLEKLCTGLFHDRFIRPQAHLTEGRTFWTNDSEDGTDLRNRDGEAETITHLQFVGPHRSIVVVPFFSEQSCRGFLQFRNREPGQVLENELRLYEGFSQVFAIASADRDAQLGLRERVKELTCLYQITQLAHQPGISERQLLTRLVNLLPAAWLHPELASGRIILDGDTYVSNGFVEGHQRMGAEIQVAGECRGRVEVNYSDEKPELDEGPFLKEERSLLDAVAEQLTLILERREAEESSRKLERQLRHADRLATIGQLGAGVAHELNEPLGTILGFTQLIQKTSKIPSALSGDLKKIEAAALHAREVIRKLLTLARETPPKQTGISLNKVVEESLYFLESRCVKEGIELVRELSPALPRIVGDPGQLQQVLVNLVVNAIQAMPRGGRLTIKTSPAREHVSLWVEDTGVGMTKGVESQIFVPFFTTKEIGRGTGLGLAVAHGIVTAHGGVIRVESALGTGTTFEVQLPLQESNEGDIV